MISSFWCEWMALSQAPHHCSQATAGCTSAVWKESRVSTKLIANRIGCGQPLAKKKKKKSTSQSWSCPLHSSGWNLNNCTSQAYKVIWIQLKCQWCHLKLAYIHQYLSQYKVWYFSISRNLCIFMAMSGHWRTFLSNLLHNVQWLHFGKIINMSDKKLIMYDKWHITFLWTPKIPLCICK